MESQGPIGVFDSGLGGLTVFKALREALPHEDFIYLGDTARLPYGTKSKDAVVAATLCAVGTLVERHIKYLVVACNTVSAQALESIQNEFPDLPLCGVIAAGAEAAVKATQTGIIAVLATEGTVNSNVCQSIIHSLRPDAKVQMLACNLLVALAEEGWCEGPEADIVVARYLSMLEPGFDTLVLACTHFPLLAPVIKKHLSPDIKVVDGAFMTAQSVKSLLEARQNLNSQKQKGSQLFLVTDLPRRFSCLAMQVLGQDISRDTELVNLLVLPFPKQPNKLNLSA